MSIINLARLSRPLRTSHTRSFSGINIIQDLKDTHNREITRFHHSSETQLSKLRKELKSLQRAKIKWERQDLKKRRDEQKLREQERVLERSVEAQLMVWVSNYLERLMSCYAGRQNQTSARGRQAQKRRVCYLFLAYVRAYLPNQTLYIPRSDVIDSLYRRRLDAPGPQSVLSAIIDINAYASSRCLAISLLDPTLQPDQVDEAGHDLYRACLPLQEQGTQPVILKEGQLSLPSVAAFFALAHWARAGISVDYVLESGKVAASIGGSGDCYIRVSEWQALKRNSTTIAS